MKNENENKKQKVGMDAFKVKTISEEGIKMPLTLPDGMETGEFLIVRGQDSPTFRKAQARNNRQNLDLLKVKKGKKEIDPADLAMRQAKSHTNLVAVLVVGWSFEEEFSTEAVIELLEEAPQLEQEINHVAAERSRFFKKPLTDCENTPEEVSG